MMKDSQKITVDLTIYPLDAVHRATYVFIDRSYVFLEPVGKNKVNIFLKGKRNLAKKQMEKLEKEFLNELLYCTLRTTLSKSNKKIRESIIERALYSSVDEDDMWIDGEEGTGDPLGIAVPWEENEK